MPVESASAVDVPAAEPHFIANGDRSLFAWHHSPAPAAHVRRAASVVLCPALGYEYMSAYRTWRLLAERLAALGFDVVRLDYDGTGNSAGSHADQGRVDAWLRSVRLAIAEARRLSGSGAVALVGLRAGALLAVQAAADNGGVDRLVLWSAFSSGRAYVRELEAFARLSRQDHTGDDDDEGAINAAGHLTTSETARALSPWTLDAITVAPARETLIVERDDRPADATLPNRLDSLGSRVSRIRAPGTAEMLAPPHFAVVPQQVLDRIADWFQDWRLPSPSASRSGMPGLASAADRVGSYREEPIRFGPRNRLFGILTTPTDDRGSAPAIILFNTGVEHHVGPHRLYVPLARDWAAHGHAVLRFDLGGLGDSTPPPGADENVAYPAHMLDDAREAVAFMRGKTSDRALVAAGLCSGGWLAFQAARHGLAVDGIVSVNPPLYLRDPDRGDRWLSEIRDLNRYRQSMRDRRKWPAALRGATNAVLTRAAAVALAYRIAPRLTSLLGSALPDSLAADLRTIADRRIRSLFVFSHADEGLRYFQHFGEPALRRAGVRTFVRHVIVEDAGHSFFPQAAQRTLRALLDDFIESQPRISTDQ